MASKRYLITGSHLAVVTDMTWSVAINITNDKSYQDEFGGSIEKNSDIGTLDELGNNAYQLGLVSSSGEVKDSGHVSLALNFKNALPTLDVDTSIPTLLIVPIQSDTLYALGVHQGKILIDMSIQLNADEWDKTTCRKIANDMADYSLIHSQSWKLYCSPSVQVNSTELSLFMGTCSLKEHQTLRDDFEISSLIIGKDKKSIIAIKQVGHFPKKATRKYAPYFVVIGCALFLAWRWYASGEEGNARIAEIQRIANERAALLEQQIVPEQQLVKTTAPDLEQWKSQLIAEEKLWLSLIENSTDSMILEHSIKAIKHTIIEMNGWKITEVIIESAIDLELNQLTINRKDIINRANSNATVQAGIYAYPDALIDPTGDLLTNSTSSKFKIEELVPHHHLQTERDFITSVITGLQLLKVENQIDQWSIGFVTNPRFRKLPKQYINLLEEKNTDELVGESSWLTPVKKITINVTGQYTSILDTISMMQKERNLPLLLKKISYNLDTQYVTAEFIAYVYEN
ncbi:hypothetical protein [Vibrio anguillarum]|uniref:Uncharacterized protein n=1 Tax=Vibrio anguillarum TaxID=55601 RepID=A0ABR9Z7D0_VIBAN|nr:hypothetical protein [Vibrio anguillarum]MBF4374360.1 hypothetical protein [Vibrio anguillarum]